MEVSLVWSDLEVLVLDVVGSDLRSGNSGAVEWDRANGRGWGRLVREWLRELHVQELRWADSPCVAKDGIRLAAKHSKAWWVWRSCQQRNALVESRLGGVAHAEARLISASHENHPGLDTSAGRRCAWPDDLIVVVQPQAVTCTVRSS